MIPVLDRAFLAARRSPFLYRFTLFTRILLAAGFIPTGMVKLLGQRFTQISVENPIGAFFEAMFQTGAYWQFLGATQVLAGILLLFPRTAHLGAALFLPIMVNIFVITISIPFGGTPWVTGAMLVAVLYLCAWDYHRFRGLLTPTGPPSGFPLQPAPLDGWERVGFSVFAVSLLVFFMTTRGFVSRGLVLYCLTLGVLAGLATLGRFLFVVRRTATNNWVNEAPPGGPHVRPE